MVKNLGEFGELHHDQFNKFFANFHYFHIIPYANGFHFAKVFSTKLPTVLIHQTFLSLNFYYTVPLLDGKIFYVVHWKKLKIANTVVLTFVTILNIT